MRDNSHGAAGARAEARGLLPLLLSGSTLEEIRELIAVPPRIERVLRAYARTNAEDAYWIEANLKFRQAVGREFERLVREGVPVVELPEVEKPERDTTGRAFANAQA